MHARFISFFKRIAEKASSMSGKLDPQWASPVSMVSTTAAYDLA
jgi:hypothetical protein